MQGNRFLELLERNPIEVYLMNTGRVGGARGGERSKKVQIPHSLRDRQGASPRAPSSGRPIPTSATRSPTRVPGIEASDLDILQPRRLYEATGRSDEYAERVARLKAERAEFLGQFPSLSAGNRRRVS